MIILSSQDACEDNYPELWLFLSFVINNTGHKTERSSYCSQFPTVQSCQAWASGDCYTKEVTLQGDLLWNIM